MLGLLFYVLYIVICDTILSPSCTVRCPGTTESLVLLYGYNGKVKMVKTMAVTLAPVISAAK